MRGRGRALALGVLLGMLPSIAGDAHSSAAPSSDSGPSALSPVEISSVVAILSEGFWRFTLATAETTVVWTAFVSPDTIFSDAGATVTELSPALVLVELVFEPALACTAYEFVDPPLPTRSP